jgi:bacteriocin biosynthesis cyclodehydratase domain-containing protein
MSFTLYDDSKSGRLCHILQRLDGSISPAGLAKETGASREEVEQIIDHLDELGVVEDTPSSALDYYLDTMVPTISGSRSPNIRPVTILGDDDIARTIGSGITAALPQATVSIPESTDPDLQNLFEGDLEWMSNGDAYYRKMLLFERWKGSVVIMAQTTINPIQFSIVNRVCLAHRIPWMHAAIDGPFLLVGPLFIPYRSACYACLEKRVIMNMRQDAGYQAYKAALIKRQVQYGAIPVSPLLTSLLGTHCAMEIVNFLLTDYGFTVSKVLGIFIPTMEFSFSEVLRVPGCGACGAISERDEKELHFDIRALLQRSIAKGVQR